MRSELKEYQDFLTSEYKKTFGVLHDPDIFTEKPKEPKRKGV
jgi:hypothetical protein